MKLKLDENLPEALIASLAALGHDVDNVRLEGLAGRDDPTVWQAAQESGEGEDAHHYQEKQVRNAIRETTR